MPDLSQSAPWTPTGTYPLGTTLTASALTLTQGGTTVYGPSPGTAGPDTDAGHTVVWPTVVAGVYGFTLSITAGGSTQALTGTVTVYNASAELTAEIPLTYTPDDPSHAAVEIIQGGVTYGGYPATVKTDGLGNSALVFTVHPGPNGLIPGAAIIQPGTLIDGVFTAVGGIINGNLTAGAAGISPFLANLPKPPAPIYAFQPSGPKIRDEMRRMVQALLGEIDGTPGSAEPAMIDVLLSAEADRLARDTYCLFQSVSQPVVVGQADYCAPQVFKITGTFITYPSGTVCRLRQRTSRDMDEAMGLYGWGCPAFDGGGVDWRNASPGPPQFYLWDGLNTVTLAPSHLFTPALSAPAILTVEGFATTMGLWDNPTDFCPLPERAHITVVYGALLARAAQFPSKVNVGYYKGLYDEGKANLEREAATLARRSHRRGQYGGYY